MVEERVTPELIEERRALVQAVRGLDEECATLADIMDDRNGCSEDERQAAHATMYADGGPADLMQRATLRLMSFDRRHGMVRRALTNRQWRGEE